MKKTIQLLAAAILAFASLPAAAQPVRLDTTFNSRILSGKITHEPLFTALGAVQQPNGKIVALLDANGLTLVRFNSDGSRDLAFGTNGKASALFLGSVQSGNAVVLQADGKIVVAGLYFYRLSTSSSGSQAGNFAQTKKMLLVK
ncbi:MAG: hypothetical protein IAF08_06180 [Rhizobacter sp.]|nr:hypothetical protein [Chlorobiales bacterium]